MLAAVNMTVVFLTVFMLPEANLSWLPSWTATFALVAALDAVTFWLIMRWSGNGTHWDHRHKLALVIEFLAFFIAFDVLNDLGERFGGLSIVAVPTAWGLWKLWVRTQAQYADRDSLPREVSSVES